MPKVKHIGGGLLLAVGVSLLVAVLASCTDAEQTVSEAPAVNTPSDDSLLAMDTPQTIKIQEVLPTSDPPATTRVAPTPAETSTTTFPEPEEPVVEVPSTTTLPEEEPVEEVPPTTTLQEPEEVIVTTTTLPVKEEPVEKVPPTTTLPAKEEPIVEAPPTTTLPEEEPVVEVPPTTTLPEQEEVVVTTTTLPEEEPVEEVPPTTTQPPEDKLTSINLTDECLKTYSCAARESIQLASGEMGCVNPEVWEHWLFPYMEPDDEGVWQIVEIIDICCPEGWRGAGQIPESGYILCTRY